VRELSDRKALEKATDTEVWRTITQAAPTTTTKLTRQKIRIRNQEKETTVIVFLTLDPNLPPLPPLPYSHHSLCLQSRDNFNP
jgi:hypothetical protein